MDINWAVFTPWSSLLGGIMIGLASALLVFTNGRSAGISGIVAGVFNVKTPDLSWRLAFLLGLLVAPVSYSEPIHQFGYPNPSLNLRWPDLLSRASLLGSVRGSEVDARVDTGLSVYRDYLCALWWRQ